MRKKRRIVANYVYRFKKTKYVKQAGGELKEIILKFL